MRPACDVALWCLIAGQCVALLSAAPWSGRLGLGCAQSSRTCRCNGTKPVVFAACFMWQVGQPGGTQVLLPRWLVAAAVG